MPFTTNYRCPTCTNLFTFDNPDDGTDSFTPQPGYTFICPNCGEWLFYTQSHRVAVASERVKENIAFFNPYGYQHLLVAHEQTRSRFCARKAAKLQLVFDNETGFNPAEHPIQREEESG